MIIYHNVAVPCHVFGKEIKEDLIHLITDNRRRDLDLCVLCLGNGPTVAPTIQLIQIITYTILIIKYFIIKNSINSIDYFKCGQRAGRSPVTHHTTPSNRDWVTIDYKHTLQSIHSTLGRSQRPIPLPCPIGVGIYQYIHTGPLGGI